MTSPSVAFVTGAADGIGLAVTEQLVRDGAAVGMVDLNADRLAVSAARLQAHGHRVVAIAGDVADETVMTDAVAATEAEFGPLDAVSSNVGIAPYGELLSLSVADWNTVMTPNLTGSFVVTTAAARAMIASGTPGSIVTMASGAAYTGRVGGGRYSTSKAALVMLTKILAMEVGAHGIRVNSVAPGLVDHGYREGIGPFVSPEYAARARQATPLAHTPTATDIADVVCYLLSSRSAFVSGEDVRVDGAAGVGRYDTPWNAAGQEN
ncbi:SDR family NAD(P)-dependent oxidoreductase [Microbacterium immunditiarum]|uniref:3-oxoacyl-[acyl-carrier protein] reductase n=1 Tax=Microbacterium immunditiarum TaxID=337480 RepID=A0A7Y9GSF1_9MICO|nr:SDR family NAD(P)-dependent oxidoreductase [Microbacterium immunditiarum]NYE21536.1 3-oxoacyl-[acyl-carrier protein] reductase [Microbacterium immunditiarum]